MFDRRYHPLNFKRNDTPHSNKSKTSSEKHQHKDDKIGKGMLSTRIDRNVDMKMK